jgi:ribonuclease E
MTPEEQDVYAQMGISPLLRLEQEIKDPKSVVLSVVFPGELDEAEQSPKEAEATASEQSEKAEVPEQVLVGSSVESSAPASSENSSSAEKPDNGSPILRRRRRRSSASEGGDSTAAKS